MRSLLPSASLVGVLVSLAGCSATFRGRADVQVTEGTAIKGHVVIRLVNNRLDYEGGSIEFDYDKAQLKADQATTDTLTAMRDFLNAFPRVKVRIEARTDSRGSRDYNRELSVRRAGALRAWLTAQGISEDRLTAVGLGEDQAKGLETQECYDKIPQSSTDCEAVWAKSRRASFAVVQGADSIAP